MLVSKMELFLSLCAASKIDGQPIVNLPERIVKLKQAEFSDEERAFYNNLENESRKQFQVFDFSPFIHEDEFIDYMRCAVKAGAE